MEIVKKSSELARSSELAQPCGFKSFDLKNEFLLRRAKNLSYIRPNIASTCSLTQFLHTKKVFCGQNLKKSGNYDENLFQAFSH